MPVVRNMCVLCVVVTWKNIFDKIAFATMTVSDCMSLFKTVMVNEWSSVWVMLNESVREMLT